MKKLVKIFAVVMVCALALCALVACAPTPNTDYDKATKNLKDNKYAVQGCTKDDDGFEYAVVVPVAMVAGTKAEDIEAVLMAESDDGEDGIQMVWFTSADAAKSFHEGYKKLLDKAGDDAEDMILGISGKVVYMGTKAAINATK